ncbi:FliG C-terminal domain-containing protein [Paenarthrobacter nitroguajacolicus]|uniref:FliG C-terminal domain-containing protein n=1 Tax=Paenarthrobacter nitroguajacolicus TaxID=211146 RepID=UPI0015BD9CAF|nr:FliG C-terminal domain-containing protein [Paenarthrobacter nitroguajacolicus]NWL34176.1 hypothetical protein [Paenarthrobacter nitroguajacolicus]
MLSSSVADSVITNFAAALLQASFGSDKAAGLMGGVASPTLLGISVKGVSGKVLETVRNTISDRNREILACEMTNAGPVRASQVDEHRPSSFVATRRSACNKFLALHLDTGNKCA